MRKELIGFSEINTEASVFYCSYYVTSQTKFFPDADGETEVYGIEVCSTKGERCTVPDISPDEKYVTELCSRFAAASVTPCTLYDVVEDCIG